MEHRIEKNKKRNGASKLKGATLLSLSSQITFIYIELHTIQFVKATLQITNSVCVIKLTILPGIL